jgi:hypothetical protein
VRDAFKAMPVKTDRKLAVVLHRMLADSTPFAATKAATAA